MKIIYYIIKKILNCKKKRFFNQIIKNISKKDITSLVDS